MKITVYQNPKAFLADAQAFLETDEAPNSLINSATQQMLDKSMTSKQLKKKP